MKKACLLLLGATGCASITTGATQQIMIETTPVSGAECELSNDVGKWYLKDTPDTVQVSRSYSNLSVVCTKQGYEKGMTTVSSGTKAVAYGNILAGGIIGGAVDMSTGAAYDYQTPIRVKLGEVQDLTKTEEPQPQKPKSKK